MIEAAVVALRLLQFAAGSILMGSALFAIYALRGKGPPWLRPLLLGGAVVLFVAALLSYLAQTALLAGSWDAALTGEALGAVLGMSLGHAALWRAGAAGLAALVLLLGRPGPSLWVATAALGLVAVASFGWMGHGAASEGWTQLVADVVHVVAAAAWIGALAAFVLLLRAPHAPAQIDTAERALRRFSAVGVPLVALLALSGLVNGWMLVGPAHLAALPATGYGQLLLLKLALFAGILGLAVLNRNRHTPALAHQPGDPRTLRRLRRSVALEFLLGLMVLAAVAWLGTLSPPGAG